MLNDDIVMAQKIVSGSFDNISDSEIFHDMSFIYKFTNESIIEYQKYLKNRKRAFIITASGDQILNSILEGTFDVTSCDVSRFPKYFFELKKAAILSLSRDEYLDFFLKDDNYDDILNDDIYDYFRGNMNDQDREFWDGLFQFFEGGEIYNSSLFSREIVTYQSVMSRNSYLEEGNYNLLKENLAKANVNHQVGYVDDVILNDDRKYDLVNLSSIIYYYTGDYKRLLESINLSDDGVVLSYLYNCKNKQSINDFCSAPGYTFDKLKKSNDGVIVYQKMKK